MKKNFFISFNKADRDWATWVAWVLEDAGYTVEFQDWDFRPGENFVLKMHQAIQNTERTLLILSEDFLNSSFTAAEWSSVFAQDPDTRQRKLVPLKVRPCKPDGLLGPIVYVNLTNLSEQEAKAALLGSFSERGKPATAPKFPGSRTTPSAPFPGQSAGGSAPNRVTGDARSEIAGPQ
jgi:hypothetical protein